MARPSNSLTEPRKKIEYSQLVYSQNKDLETRKPTIILLVNDLRKQFVPNLTAGLSKAAFLLLILYAVSAVLLSVFIFLRLQVLPTTWVKYANIALYFLNYHIIAFLALAWLLSPLFSLKQKNLIKQFLLSLSFAAMLVLSYLLLMIVSLFGIVPEYMSLSIPIVLVFLVYLVQHKPQKRPSKKIVAPILAGALAFILLIPHVTAFACYNSILFQASTVSNKDDRATFISKIVYDTTAFDCPFLKEYLRANRDLQKYLLVGVGACGEMAMVTTIYLKNLGFEARKAGFPGEDHSFIEVKIDDEWRVLDPGYFPSTLLTRSERAADRVNRVGTISYVAAYTESSFIELTPQYVDTDIITISITNNGEPLADASIILVHTLRYDSNAYNVQLPGEGFSFYTDANGTVTVHLGKLTYVAPFEKTDPYYWIYVNGQNTGHNVTSTGTGKAQLVEIDLAPRIKNKGSDFNLSFPLDTVDIFL